MKKNTFFLLLSFMVLLGLSACAQNDSTPTPVVYDSTNESSTGKVIADGEIVPAEDIQIVSQLAGVVDQILVDEGQIVQAGDVLFRLEDQKDVLAQLETAKFEELSAQQALDDLNLYADLDKEQLYQQILDAQIVLQNAQKAWDDFDQDKYDDDIEKAKEKIADAKQDLDDAEDDLSDYLDLDEDNATRKSRQDAVDRAQTALNDAERERDDLEREKDQLQVSLDLADANLTALQAEYDKYNNGPDADKLAAAEGRLAAAKANVEALQAAIDKLEVRAPLSGTVAMLDLSVGDVVYAGQVVGKLADFSSWYVETSDLNELEVVRIQVGDVVEITLDAFPNQTLTGTVVQIKDYAELKYSDVIYPVRIQLDTTDLELRWKMSAVVSFP